MHFHPLLSTVRSLDTFKFDVIVDDSFLPFERADDNEWKFFVKQFFQKRTQTEMAKGEMTKVAVKTSQNVS